MIIEEKLALTKLINISEWESGAVGYRSRELLMALNRRRGIWSSDQLARNELRSQGDFVSGQGPDSRYRRSR